MSNYIEERMKGKTAEELRAMAAECRQRSADSFERSDTDGFLSQWASDMSAQQYEKQAEIAEHGGRYQFTGLYEGDRRIAARVVEVPAFNRPGSTVFKWELNLVETVKFGRRYVPMAAYSRKSRVQTELKISERREWAPAKAIVTTGGRDRYGLSGCANAYVRVQRTGDEWGRDAELIPGDK